MSAVDCRALGEVAPELALGLLHGAERAAALEHLGRCSRCQTLVAELGEVADVLVTLVPEQEPPAGFEARVLRSLGAPRRRRARRLLAVAAAVAAAATISSITIVRVIDASQEPSSPTANGQVASPPTAPAAARMATAEGVDAGWAYVAADRGLAVTVDYGVAAGEYDVRVRSAGGDAGTARTAGTMAVTAGRGSWTGRSPVPLGAGSSISLVAPDGTEACHGTVEGAQ